MPEVQSDPLATTDYLIIAFNGLLFYVLQVFNYVKTIFDVGNYLKKLKDNSKYKYTDNM